MYTEGCWFSLNRMVKRKYWYLVSGIRHSERLLVSELLMISPTDLAVTSAAPSHICLALTESANDLIFQSKKSKWPYHMVASIFQCLFSRYSKLYLPPVDRHHQVPVSIYDQFRFPSKFPNLSQHSLFGSLFSTLHWKTFCTPKPQLTWLLKCINTFTLACQFSRWFLIIMVWVRTDADSNYHVCVVYHYTHTYICVCVWVRASVCVCVCVCVCMWYVIHLTNAFYSTEVLFTIWINKSKLW